jgi:serine/threonine protein kinase
LVKNDGTACLGEFSDERKPTTDTLTQYANYIAPELVDVSKLYKITVDHYREMEYEGEYRTASDIFALGCVMIEVRQCSASTISFVESHHFLKVYTGAPPEPLRIPYEKLKDYAELANLRRTPTSHEQEIPPKILSILQAMLQYIPLRRPNSGLAKTWLENPDGLRLTATVPVLAKRQLWPAFREMTRISP